MKAKELIEKLQQLDPEVEVLGRTCYYGDVDWEPIDEVSTVSTENVGIVVAGKWGYHQVPCARLEN